VSFTKRPVSAHSVAITQGWSALFHEPLRVAPSRTLWLVPSFEVASYLEKVPCKIMKSPKGASTPGPAVPRPRRLSVLSKT